MAATLAPQSLHHLNVGPAFYSVGTSHTLPVSGSVIESYDSTGTPVQTQQQRSVTSPQRWAAQQAFQRPLSKSPSFRDRTPIRHHRSDMSRHRSSSRSEALLAFAEEQARQTQQGHTENVQFMPSMDPPMQNYQTQQYTFPSATSPYMHQQSFYDNSGTQASYVQLPVQPNPQSSASMYATGIRASLSMGHLSGQALNPNDTLYTQAGPTQMPPVGSVPSNFPPIPQPLESTPNEADMVGSRQKPQCWDHGCNGRKFSTFSNLLRHQREKSGTAAKARCPHCGTEFTRTTARNGHLYGGKCKGMPDESKDGEEQTKEQDP